MGYLDELRAFVSQKGPDEALTKPTKGGSVSFVSASPARLRENRAPAEQLRFWWKSLCAVDPCAPLPGFERNRWADLYDCSIWWLDAFGRTAAHDGWGTGDVFGVLPGMPGLGGIIDRFSKGLCHLRDRPGLVMTANTASWRVHGETKTFNQTGSREIQPFWGVGSTTIP
ncbi:hypothetical protein [Pelagerythrobacter aerophilus]|uniref:hypothetical protein n=1 Tax=Pelagerythrobacter aerophilus TaxID=2306995 RepID=UPI0011C47261|nr:hypothetical protein [Pelagerythrobacter aerophilus]